MIKKQIVLMVTVLIVSPIFWVTGINAQSSTSPNYGVNEYFFGTGGELESCSTGPEGYCSQGSAGSLNVGSTSSSNFDSEGGFLTRADPFLEMQVTGAVVDLGVLSDTATSSGAAQAGTCNCSFSIRSYLSSDYAVVTISNPPTNESGDILTAKSVLGVPSVDQNVEEFGMNLVANTLPSTMGATPKNQPSGTFADGEAATGYSTLNQFKYGVGDTIARAAASAGNQAVGQTDYTVSYIAKINSVTPAGLYSMLHTLVVVPTY